MNEYTVSEELAEFVNNVGDGISKATEIGTQCKLCTGYHLGLIRCIVCRDTYYMDCKERKLRMTGAETIHTYFPWRVVCNTCWLGEL